MVYNTCESCGTLNFFDETTHQMFSKAKCYHCGNMVYVPDAYELVKNNIFEQLQNNTYPALKNSMKDIHTSIADITAWKDTFG